MPEFEYKKLGSNGAETTIFSDHVLVAQEKLKVRKRNDILDEFNPAKIVKSIFRSWTKETVERTKKAISGMFKNIEVSNIQEV